MLRDEDNTLGRDPSMVSLELPLAVHASVVLESEGKNNCGAILFKAFRATMYICANIT
jgi:hypothetical protein